MNNDLVDRPSIASRRIIRVADAEHKPRVIHTRHCLYARLGPRIGHEISEGMDVEFMLRQFKPEAHQKAPARTEAALSKNEPQMIPT